MDIKLQTLPCRLILKDVDGFLNHSMQESEASLVLAKKLAVLKTICVFYSGITASGIVGYDTGIDSNIPFHTIALSEFEINQFFELDVTRELL